MNIQQMRYVLAVVDYENFEIAAEHCFVTQSTLSTMIRKLEEELGLTFFNGKTKPVSITSEGQLIIDRFRIILNEVEGVKNLVQELKGEMVGELKIGVIPTIAPYLLPLILERFAGKFPKVKIVVNELTTSEIEAGLSRRKIDIGILAIPLKNKSITETTLYKEPFLVYDCSEELKNGNIEIDQIDSSKLCLLKEGHCLTTQVSQICELSDANKRNEKNYTFESGSMDSLLRITASRKGITVIPFLTQLGLTSTQKGNVRQFSSPVPTREIGLVTNELFVKDRLLKGLVETIQQEVQPLLPSYDRSLIINPLIN